MLYRAACSAGSFVELSFAVYFREWGRQIGTLGFLTASETQKFFFLPTAVNKLVHLLDRRIARKL